MEVVDTNSNNNSGSGSNGAVTITQASFSVNDQLLEDDDVEDLDLELPETTYRSHHHHLLNALQAGDDSDDFEDLQFFHRSSRLEQFKYQQQQVNNLFQEHGEFGIVDVSNLSITGSLHGSTNNSSENPFVFPDNVMEYGEPQFFPGNCVGYLETILEETDEEYEEEEGCSGRHWWTADSDTDTDSVIRVDNNSKTSAANNTNNAFTTNNSSFAAAYTKDFLSNMDKISTATNNATNNGTHVHSNSLNNKAATTTFRTTASSKPFEMEDLHLLDQLDLAFEETLMEPRRRSGIASGDPLLGATIIENHSVLLSERKKMERLTDNRSNNMDEPLTELLFVQDEKKVDEEEEEKRQEHEAEPRMSNNSRNSKSESSDDEQPAEVNEEDFFYTTSEDSDEGSEENSEEATSSDDGKTDGVVLAEFSLNSSFNSAMTNRYRRSFEGSSKLRSFRSFDSLNCLAGTELLFSKADTFPSFGYIAEVAEPSSTSDVAESGSAGSGSVVGAMMSVGGSSSSSSSRDRKNSDSSAEQLSGSGGRATEMSTENLSEDSGIGGDGAGTGSALNLNLNSPQLNLSSLTGASNTAAAAATSTTTPTCSSANEPNSLGSYIAKSEFALNPFVFSSASASEENSMSSSFFHSGQDGLLKESVVVVQQQIVPPQAQQQRQQLVSEEEEQQGEEEEGEDEDMEEEGSVTSVSHNQNTRKEIKNDNGLPEEEQKEECQTAHPISHDPTLVKTISNLRSTTAVIEPDVVAQCSMNESLIVPAIISVESSRNTNGHSHYSTSSSSNSNCEDEDDDNSQPEGKPCTVIERVEGLPQLPTSEHEARAQPLTLDLPTPHSEVLLKFTGEDEIITNNNANASCSSGSISESDKEDEDDEEEEEEEDEVTIITTTRRQPTTTPSERIPSDSMGNDNTNKRNMSVAAPQLPSNEAEGTTTTTMEEESGPMSTLSSVAIAVAAQPAISSSPLVITTESTPMGSPSLHQKNNNASNNSALPVVVSSHAWSHNEESLLFEYTELQPPRGSAYSTEPFIGSTGGSGYITRSEEQEQQPQPQPQQGDSNTREQKQESVEQQQQQQAFAHSVCVQKSSWSDVVHHQEQPSSSPLLPSSYSTATTSNTSPTCDSESEFISGSSKFGRSHSQVVLLESNLDLEECESSLALTEHLCNSRRDGEKIVRLDNGISACIKSAGSSSGSSVSANPSSSSFPIEKPPGLALITSPTRALEGEQCTNESLITLKPTTVISTAAIVPTATVVLSPNNSANHNSSSNPTSPSPTYHVPDIVSLSDPTTTTTVSPGEASNNNRSNGIRDEEMEVERSQSTGGTTTTSPHQPSSVVPIRTKTYGARNEVEVFLVSSRTPSPSPIIKTSERESSPHILASSSSPTGEGRTTTTGKKEVHFCPVVSEISWRESYTDQGSENSGSSEDLLDSSKSSNEFKQFVTVSEQVTQPLENVILLSKGSGSGASGSSSNSSGAREMTSSTQNNNASEQHEIMPRHHPALHGKSSTNGHVYEDVGCGNNMDSSSSSLVENANKQQQPSTLSMVPDLLSQCENIPQTRTHITVNIEEQRHHANPQQQQQQQQQQLPQQQIFPSMFAEKSDSKNGKPSNSSSSSGSNKKVNVKSLQVSSTPAAPKNPSATTQTSGSNKKSEKSKEVMTTTKEDAMIIKDKGKQSKPGFFERLSKIRLSGSKNKKKKIHPKENEIQEKSLTAPNNQQPTITGPNNTTIIVTSESKSHPITSSSSSSVAGAKAKSPILKKFPANTPTPVNPSSSLRSDEGEPSIIIDDEAEKSHEAFENILQDIAGINAIKLRQKQQPQGIPSSSSPPPPSNSQPNGTKLRSFAERKQFFVNPATTTSGEPHERAGSPLDTKLSQFMEETTRTRDQLSKSHPDLEVIQGVVRDSITIETRVKEREKHHTLPSTKKLQSSSSSPGNGSNCEETTTLHLQQQHHHPAVGGVEPKNEREWYKLLKSAAEKYYYRGEKDKAKTFKTGIVETDLDTGASREMLNVESEVVVKVPSPPSTVKTQSLTNLSSSTMPLSLPPHHHTQDLGLDEHHLLPQGDLSDSDERAKSMEFLLDGNHKSSSVPPENQLRLECRQLSEHELRIQRSLQKLDVPEWYKKHTHSTAGQAAVEQDPMSPINKPAADTKLNKRSEFGSASGLAGGWAGLSAYKTNSLSSLQNQGRYTGINRSNFVRGRPATMSSVTRSSRESLLSPSSTASQSPSAFERCSFTYGMPFTLTRFGHGRLSTGSASISPPSTPVNPVGPSYVKKPYLGWRSQERLNNSVANSTNPPGTNPSNTLRLSLYRPPAERLAAEILSARSRAGVKTVDRPPALPRPPPRGDKTILTNRNPELVLVTSPSSSPATTTTSTSPLPTASSPNVHDSIRQVTEQINQFVRHGEEIVQDEPPRPKPRTRPGKRPTLWIESSFVGCKPGSN